MKLFSFARSATTTEPEHDQLRRRDASLLAIRRREREDVAERVEAGLVDAIVLERFDREIRNIERRMESRDAELASQLERASRREREMPMAVRDLEDELAAFVAADLPRFLGRVRDLEQKAQTITRLYGRDVGGHVVGVPDWFCLVQGHVSLANAMSDRTGSLLSRWKEFASKFGFTVHEAAA